MKIILAAEISTDLVFANDNDRMNFEMTVQASMTRWSMDGVPIVRAVHRMETQVLDHPDDGYTVILRRPQDGATEPRPLLSRDGKTGRD